MVQIFQRESIFCRKISSGESLFIKKLVPGGTNLVVSCPHPLTRPYLRKVAAYCKETSKEKEREAEEQENRFQCFMDRTGEPSLLWALFGERCVHQSLPLSLGTLHGVLKVAHKFCGPVFQSECTLLVIQPWHLIAFELTFCKSCSFICGCVMSFYQSLTLDELAALSATSFVDLLVTYY